MAPASTFGPTIPGACSHSIVLQGGIHPCPYCQDPPFNPNLGTPPATIEALPPPQVKDTSIPPSWSAPTSEEEEESASPTTETSAGATYPFLPR
mmetsp:Transcript_20342/g.48906  ORF Transcript_20342/g.48906 Transcript_20342/m.48906 type:complete len:94 (+) Transcript_20342:512-793(+)